MTNLRGIIETLTRPRGSGLAAGAALGGLALIAALAHRSAAGRRAAEKAATAPELNEDDAETVLRAMVAATVADGLVDAGER